MLIINQLKINIDENNNEKLRELAAKKLRLNVDSIKKLVIIKKSIDARKKPDIYYIYSVAVEVDNEEKVLKKLKDNNISKYNRPNYTITVAKSKPCKRPIIIGFGPAGLFAGLALAKAGLNPIIFERGLSIDKRTKLVEKFWETGILDTRCNVQFGEGGAGAFSDGKLNTLVNDKTGKNAFVLNEFIKHGANKNILYDAKPHVGTDILVSVVSGIRKEIEELGGQVFFDSKLCDISYSNNALKSITIELPANYNTDSLDDKITDNTVNNTSQAYKFEDFETDDLILAIGHSARDTFEMLHNKGVYMEAKDFAVGFRIEHPQKMIGQSLYGDKYTKLEPAAYKLTNNINDRGVYSFCMCPGGYVVNASSSDNQAVVNGMSYSNRDSQNANSAIVVSVGQKEFDKTNPLAGVEYQKTIENKSYELAKGQIPQQLLIDFKLNRVSTDYGDFNSCTKGKTQLSNLRNVYSEDINNALINSLEVFEKRISGFNRADAILSGIESRTSSPVRIRRDDITFYSNIEGIYPCGEGCGYAGGIMSAAYDGLRIAEKIINKYQ